LEKDVFKTNRKNWPFNFKQLMSWGSRRSWNIVYFSHHLSSGKFISVWLRDLGQTSDSEMEKLFDKKRLLESEREYDDRYDTPSVIEAEDENSGTPSDAEAEGESSGQPSYGTSKAPIVVEDNASVEDEEVAEDDVVGDDNAADDDNRLTRLGSSHNPNKDYIDWVENGFPTDSLTEDQVRTLLVNGYFDPPPDG
jgi:hypothetical protein